MEGCCYLAPKRLPYLFLYMDSEEMFERALELCYGKTQAAYTGKDVLHTEVQAGFTLKPAVTAKPKLARRAIESIIETCLFTTAGDSILKVVYDANGDLMSRSRLTERDPFKHFAKSAHFRKEGSCRSDDDHCLRD